MKKFAPPPTKFGSISSGVTHLQLKAAPQGQVGMQPPPTKFGNAQLQTKIAPTAHAAGRSFMQPKWGVSQLPRTVKVNSHSAQTQMARPLFGGTIQKMEYNSLSDVSKAISGLSGYRETATFSFVLHDAPNQNANGSEWSVFGQRYYTNVDDDMGVILGEIGAPLDTPYTYPDANDESNIHAEMLAVSEWLRGNAPKPWTVGASRPVCLYCERVLNHLQINIDGELMGVPTKNWVSPYLNADKPKPIGLNVPDWRTNNRNYPAGAY
jgi:hypothetical protein